MMHSPQARLLAALENTTGSDSLLMMQENI